MKYKLRLLIAGFIVSFLLVTTLSILSFTQTGNLTTRVEKVEHTYAVVNAINRLTYELLAIDKAAFRFAVIRDSIFLEDFTTAAKRLFVETERLKAMTGDNQHQRDNVVLLQADEALYLDDCRRL